MITDVLIYFIFILVSNYNNYFILCVDMRLEMERLKKRRVVNQEENEPLCLKQNCDEKVFNAS